MAQEPGESTVKIAHERGPNFIAVASDYVTFTVRADEGGASVQLNFCRTETLPFEETFRTFSDGTIVRQVAPSEFATVDKRIVECCVVMRPDQIIVALTALLPYLAALPPHLKALYKLPEMQFAGADE